MSHIRRKPVPPSASQANYNVIVHDDGSQSPDTVDMKSTERLIGGPQANTTSSLQPLRWRQILRLWVWEIIALVFCVIVLVAIAAILSNFNNRPLLDWPLRISLNASIAILSDFLKAALIIIAATIISQSKWNWFRQRARPLSHLQRFEDASRSLIGSISLLSIAPPHIPTLIACLLTLLAVATGPFIQQAVQTAYCVRNESSSTASLPVAQYFGAPAWLPRERLDPDLYGVLYNGLGAMNRNNAQITTSCSTGNCSFAADSAGVTHSSIAICSLCIDSRSQVTTKQSSGYIGFHNDNTFVDDSSLLSINATSRSPLLSQQEDITGAYGFSSFNILMRTKQYSITVNTSRDNGQSPRQITVDGVVSASCQLYPCVKRYHANISNGVFTERVVSKSPLNSLSSDRFDTSGHVDQPHEGNNGNCTSIRDTCLLDGKTYTAANISTVERKPGRNFAVLGTGAEMVMVPAECLYIFSLTYGFTLGRQLSSLLRGNCYRVLDGDTDLVNCFGYADSSTEFWWLSPLYRSGNASFNTLQSDIEQLATTLTNFMRTTGSSTTSAGDHPLVYGTAQRSFACVRMEWRWLLFPCFLVVTAIVLLSWGIITTNKRGLQTPVWKNSVLPFLFYGLVTEEQQEFPSLAHPRELETLADKTMVVLDFGDRPGFVSQTLSKEDR